MTQWRHFSKSLGGSHPAPFPSLSSPPLFSPAEIEFGAFQTKKVTSGGKNFNDFPENQLTKSRAVYTVKANRGPKFCRYSFTQDSSRVTMITEGRTELTSFHCNKLIY